MRRVFGQGERVENKGRMYETRPRSQRPAVVNVKSRRARTLPSLLSLANSRNRVSINGSAPSCVGNYPATFHRHEMHSISKYIATEHLSGNSDKQATAPLRVGLKSSAIHALGSESRA